MFVEGTLRWQVTEDCPWDLLMALCLRDLGAIQDAGDPVLPTVIPAVQHVSHQVRGKTGGTSAAGDGGEPAGVRAQWDAWWRRSVIRELRPIVSDLRPPHFAAFDRVLDLQDLICDNYEDARAWAEARHEEYVRTTMQRHAIHAADIVDVVRDREHELRRQAGYFRLDLYAMPLAQPGTWVVGPNTVVISQSLRFDSAAFRSWFTPVVAALV